MPPGKPGRWQIWKNGDGMTATIRAHLHKYHQKEWQDTVISKQLKAWDEQAGMAGPTPTRRHREPFTLKGFHYRLVKWIVANDQVRDVSLFQSPIGLIFNTTHSRSMLSIVLIFAT